MRISKVNIENYKCFQGEFTLERNPQVNILVGNNESGKSTILEAINLALTGILNGRYLKNELSPSLSGTPIDATLDVFGEVIDAYTMTESVKDEITVRIVYEGRAAKVLLDNSKLQEIEEYYAQCAEEGASEYAIEESKKANARMNSILGDPDRLRAVAEDFVKHYEKRVSEGATVKGKAMFVCSSRPIAYELYKQIIALRPEWAEAKVCEEGTVLSDKDRWEIKPMERIKMVMTRGQDDPEELYDLLGSKDYRKELDRQFKNEKSNFRIAIVVDMWLTGFDVPFLDTLYIDKPVQRHNLIQTISRVNRKYGSKEKGLIVDYIGIKKQMNLALAQYSKADSTNIEEIQQSIVVVKDHLDLLARLFHRFDMRPYFSGKPLEQLHCLYMAAEYVQVTDKIEKRFMALAKRLKAAYDICCGSDALTQSERDRIHFYMAVRSIDFKLTKGDAPDLVQMNVRVQEMIKEALQSDGIEEIFKLEKGGAKESDLFDEEDLAKLEKIKMPNTKIRLLQQLLKRAIEDFRKINKVKAADFSRMFKALVEKYNERKEQDVLVSNVLEDFTIEIIDLYHALKKEKESFADLGIDFEEKAFYDILKALAHKYDFEYPEAKLIPLSKKVKEVVDDKAKYTDWSQRNDIKAELIRTIPGAGLITSATVRAYTDDIRRFRGYKQYSAYAELTPWVQNSNTTERMGSITKGGPEELRTALIQIVLGMVRNKRYTLQFRLMRRYAAMKPHKGSGKTIIATARKLSRVIWCMLQKDQPFDPVRMTDPELMKLAEEMRTAAVAVA